MKEIFAVVVVLYKTDLDESSSVHSLKAVASHANIKLTVWDNSPSPQSAVQLEAFANSFPDSEYVHTPANISLAKIYNEVVGGRKDCQFLVILDQDSTFSYELFEQARKAAAHNLDIDLFLPFVEVDGRIYSPGHHNYIKGAYLTSLIKGRIAAKGVVAVASGTIIRMTYLLTHNPPFDERLKLYGVDTDFMLQYGERKQFVYVLNYNLTHQLSVVSNEPLASKVWRFNDMKHAVKIISRKRSRMHLVAARLYVLYLGVKYGLQYRTIRFLKPNNSL